MATEALHFTLQHSKQHTVLKFLTCGENSPKGKHEDYRGAWSCLHYNWKQECSCNPHINALYTLKYSLYYFALSIISEIIIINSSSSVV
jgi:hypothetical protein